MIVAYRRPKTVQEALTQLNQPGQRAVPIGGGSMLNRFTQEPIMVIDLQDLGLDQIRPHGTYLTIGATITLQSLLTAPNLPTALQTAIRQEASYNLRQVGTVAGTLVAADGRSAFATTMLALDARLLLQPDDEQLPLSDMLILRQDKLQGRLIAEISIPLNARLAYHQVSRTPADLPIVCAAVAVWASGRTRLTLGGFGPAPILVMDGPSDVGAEIVAKEAYQNAGDQWASAAYRSEIAGVLVKRCLDELI